MNALDRVLGFFPISIATSLAIEGLLVVGEHATDKPNDYTVKSDELWVNVRTIARNCLGAFDQKSLASLNDPILRDAVEQDIDQIKKSISDHCKLNVVFYFASHKTISKQLPEMRFKYSDFTKMTEKQQITERLENKLIQFALTHLSDQVKLFDTKLSAPTKVILLTHHPIDLLSFYAFQDLVLLESHTGRIKKRMDWDSKLKTPPGTQCIPFTLSMLTVFGDGTLVAPQDQKVKKVLIKLGEKYNWHSMTTDARILTDAKMAYEPFLVEYLKRVGKYKLS